MNGDRCFRLLVCSLLGVVTGRAEMQKAVHCYPPTLAQAKSELGIKYVVLQDHGSGWNQIGNKGAQQAIALGVIPIQVVETKDGNFPDLRGNGVWRWEARCYEVMQSNPAAIFSIGKEPDVASVLIQNGMTNAAAFSPADTAAAAKIVVEQHRIASFVARRFGKSVISGAISLGKTAHGEYPNMNFIYACLDAGLAKYIDKLAIHYGPDGSQATDPAFTSICQSLRAKSGGLPIWNLETNYGDKGNPPQGNPATALRNVWNCNKAAGVELLAWYFYNSKDVTSVGRNVKDDPENLADPSLPGFDAPTLRRTFKTL